MYSTKSNNTSFRVDVAAGPVLLSGSYARSSERKLFVPDLQSLPIRPHVPRSGPTAATSVAPVQQEIQYPVESGLTLNRTNPVPGPGVVPSSESRPSRSAVNEVTVSEEGTEVEVELVVFATERRLPCIASGTTHNSDEDDWMPYFNFSFGIESNDELSFVCHLNNDDISDLVTLELGEDEKITVIKPQGDPENKKRDYMFRLTIDPGVDHAFTGTITDCRGEWEWRGKFFCDKKLKHTKFAGIEYGPDGCSTIQELLSISNRSMEGRDIAQQEGNRIFGRILLASLPDDVKHRLYLDMPTLDAEEEKIRALAPDFLPRAAIVHLLTHLQASDKVAPAQRARINKFKCDAFFPACASVEAPYGSEKDPVKTFGWDRKKDKAILRLVQEQYRTVTLQCYHLGYCRAVTSFQPFLKHASYWYKRLANYLESPSHLRQFMMRVRVKSNEGRLERDIYDWHTKLTLLWEAANGNQDVHTAEQIMRTLHGAATLATLDHIEWNDSLKANLKEFFENLDEFDKDPFRKQDEEYARIQKLLACREAYTWSEFGKSIINVVEASSLYLHRPPTIVELEVIIHRKTLLIFQDCSPQAQRAAIRGAVVAVGMFALMHSLMRERESLSMAEKCSMYASLVEGFMLAPSASLVPSQIVSFMGLKPIAKAVGSCLESMFPRALELINAAKSFAAKWKGVRVAVAALRKTFTGGVTFVFGFFVSCFCVWAAAEEFRHALTHGRKVDKVLSGAQLLITALSCMSYAVVEIGVPIIGGELAMSATAVCGMIGPVLVSLGIGVAVVALVTTAVLKEDPVRDVIKKYGEQYGLLN